MTTSLFKRTKVERIYEITDAPDLQDSRSERRMILRPRALTLHLVPDTNLVYGAVVEGRQVRRDGELADWTAGSGRRQCVCGARSAGELSENGCPSCGPDAEIRWVPEEVGSRG